MKINYLPVLILTTSVLLMANKCCPYWDIEITMGWPFPTIKCMTGGQFKCEDCEPSGGSGGGSGGPGDIKLE